MLGQLKIKMDKYWTGLVQIWRNIKDRTCSKIEVSIMNRPGCTVIMAMGKFSSRLRAVVKMQGKFAICCLTQRWENGVESYYIMSVLRTAFHSNSLLVF